MPGNAWQHQLWSDLKATIGAAWPEILPASPGAFAGGIWRVTQIEKRDWKTLVGNGKIVPPWVVVHWPPTERASGWGAGNVVYQPRLSVYYIAKDTPPDTADAIMQKLADLEAQVKSQLGALYTILNPEGEAFDTSEENPVNVSMFEQQMPYTAGSYTFALLAGYVYNT